MTRRAPALAPRALRALLALGGLGLGLPACDSPCLGESCEAAPKIPWDPDAAGGDEGGGYGYGSGGAGGGGMGGEGGAARGGEGPGAQTLAVITADA